MRVKTECTFGVPEPGRYYHDRVGAYLIAMRAGAIALIQTPRGYFLPGGGMEPGESPEACIRRELLEETGYDVKLTRPAGAADSYEQHPVLGWFHPIQYYYLGELTRQVGVPVEADHELVWIPVQEAEGTLVPQCQRWAVSRVAGSKTAKGGDAPWPKK